MLLDLRFLYEAAVEAPPVATGKVAPGATGYTVKPIPASVFAPKSLGSGNFAVDSLVVSDYGKLEPSPTTFSTATTPTLTPVSATVPTTAFKKIAGPIGSSASLGVPAGSEQKKSVPTSTFVEPAAPSTTYTKKPPPG